MEFREKQKMIKRLENRSHKTSSRGKKHLRGDIITDKIC